MLRLLLGITAAAICVGQARAQITPITSGLPDGEYPTIGSWAPYYGGSRSPEDAGRDTEIEANYRSAVAKIPDRKPSNDPWKSIRPAATALPDRHRPQ